MEGFLEELGMAKSSAAKGDSDNIRQVRNEAYHMVSSLIYLFLIHISLPFLPVEKMVILG